VFCATEICITKFTVSCHYCVHSVQLLPCSQCPAIIVFTVSCHYRVHIDLSLLCSQYPAINVFTESCDYRIHSVLQLPTVLLSMSFDNLTSHFFKININRIVQSTHFSPKACFVFGFSGLTFVFLFHMSCVPHC
jgi:hypothetical protein